MRNSRRNSPQHAAGESLPPFKSLLARRTMNVAPPRGESSVAGGGGPRLAHRPRPFVLAASATLPPLVSASGAQPGSPGPSTSVHSIPDAGASRPGSSSPLVGRTVAEAEQLHRRQLVTSEARARQELGHLEEESRGSGGLSGGAAAWRSAVEEEEERAWLADRAHTQSLLSAGKYVDAYVAASVALRSHRGSPAREAALLELRAECSYGLMNYKECVGDCRAVVELASGDGAVGLSVVRLWVRAHVMREDYEEARRLYSAILDDASTAAAEVGAATPLPGRPALSVVERALLVRERASLPAVEELRQCIAASRWQAALSAVDAARPLLSETPLRVLEAAARLEVGDPDGAREVLQPYLPTLPAPPAAAGHAHNRDAATESSEVKWLRCNVDAHYLLVTTLLARACAYSGRPYMNIAASLLQRCLSVNGNYAPAVALGDYLVKLEDTFTLADSNARSGNPRRALELLTAALNLDAANVRINATLQLRCAEVHITMGKPLQAIDACTESIRLSPTATAGRAYLVRAAAYEQTHQSQEAAADRATASRLNPNIAAAEAERREAAEEAESARCRSAQGPQQHNSTGGRAAGASGRKPPFHSRGQAGSPPPNSRWRSDARPAKPAAPSATLYDILGVAPAATPQEVRQSFRRLTLRYHPDKLVGETEANQLRGAELFKQINNAHYVLSDAERRRVYDASLLLQA